MISFADEPLPHCIAISAQRNRPVAAAVKVSGQRPRIVIKSVCICLVREWEQVNDDQRHGNRLPSGKCDLFILHSHFGREKGEGKDFKRSLCFATDLNLISLSFIDCRYDRSFLPHLPTIVMTANALKRLSRG